jgi:hypothetical protein
VSLAANIAHSFIPPTDAGPGWSPNAGAVVGAVFWPVALFVATEILTRVTWPTGRTWWLLRWTGMLPVAVVAALVSYRHLSGLLQFCGEEPVGCVLGPLAVDGLMVMATGAILATSQHQQHHIRIRTGRPGRPITRPGPDPAVPGTSRAASGGLRNPYAATRTGAGNGRLTILANAVRRPGGCDHGSVVGRGCARDGA